MHASYLKKVNNSFLYRLFLIAKLPIAWISGLKVNKVTAEKAQISIRYKYLNQNPFKSMYFACQAMAAEMSTGLLAMGYIDSQSVKISMLVLDLNCSFTKKAIGKIQFVCEEGILVKEAIQKAVESNEGVVCVMTSKGYDEQGDCVSSFKITWSFKRKS
tara:strand:+ start:128 stop:604 length:477 start_codon:yes stop_codon:yes gene_type:complete